MLIEREHKHTVVHLLKLSIHYTLPENVRFAQTMHSYEMKMLNIENHRGTLVGKGAL